LGTAKLKIENFNVTINLLLIDQLVELPEYMGEGLIGLSKRNSNLDKEPTFIEAL